MSIKAEIERITTARNTIRTKFIALGLKTTATTPVAISDTSTIDDLASAADGITNQGSLTATLTGGTTKTYEAGYYTGGTITVKDSSSYTTQTKTVTPTTSSQTVSPDSGYYALSSVTVNAIPSTYKNTSDATATAANLLSGSTAYNSSGKITGTMANNGAISGTIDGLTSTSYTVKAGYTSGGTVSLTSDIETALAAI